jgi:hypothetical protein
VSVSRGGAALGLLLAASAAIVALGPRLSRWGATEDETSRALPGDELVADPTFASTRAITIDASPASVWPWLLQLGQGRAGLYSYDRLENLLGLDIHSADRILPELQGLEVGDTVSLGKGACLAVHALDPERTLVLRHPDGDWSWVFVLDPQDGGRTRLIVRNRWTTARATSAVRAGMKLTETIGFAMERRMLYGVKERAEQVAAAGTGSPPPDRR